MIPNPLQTRATPESMTLTITRRLLYVVSVLFAAYFVPSAVASLVKPTPRSVLAPYAFDAPPLNSTADTSTLPPHVISAMFLNELPPPDTERQLRPPCKTKLGQEDIGGFCWQRLPVDKCPKGEAYEHTNGNCYVPLLKAARPKQSGDVQPVSVAGDAE